MVPSSTYSHYNISSSKFMDPALVLSSSRYRSSSIGDMAHIVFKKPLQDKSTRDSYLKKLQELRKAKELGFIDAKSYKESKKNLLSEIPSYDGPSNSPPSIIIGETSSRLSGSTSSSSGSAVPLTRSSTNPLPGMRKGSIFDRNDVAILAYKPDAQSEEDRKTLKLQLRTQKSIASAEGFSRSRDYQLDEADEALDPSRLDHLTISPDSLSIPTRTSTTDTSASNSSTSLRSGKSQRINFNIFRKRSASTNRHSPPPLSIPNVPPIPLLYQEVPITRTRKGRRPGSVDTDKSSLIRRHTESRGGGRGAILDAMPMTFADIFLMGPPPGPKPHASRRHSFSSQNSRPSHTSSRLSSEAPTELVIRKAREEFVFESRPSSPENFRFHPHTPPEASQSQLQPVSTLLQDIFLSLLNDFSDTSILFSYPKYGRIRRVTYSSSLRSIPQSARTEEEAEMGRLIGMGEGSFLIDESITMLKAVLEKQVWFLVAMKWLSFGRALFSPGHHLVGLNDGVGVGIGMGMISESSILDLDGVITANFSWHLAEEYPFATIYNILLPHSPRPPRNSAAPTNLHSITAPSLTNLSTLSSNSIDVIVSHNLPRIIFQNKDKTSEELIQLLTDIFRECARVLKSSGYFEMTVVDPVMNNMGPRTRSWTTQHIVQADITRPSKMILAALEQLSGQEAGVLFDEVKECWVWMPTTSIGDELSTVTSMVGRQLYDHLYAPDGEGDNGKEVEIAYGICKRKECEIWEDEKVIEECQKENTAFRWLKCYARKA